MSARIHFTASAGLGATKKRLPCDLVTTVRPVSSKSSHSLLPRTVYTDLASCHSASSASLA
eukprot:4499142-Prorocentrum_lima.AAC.1